MSEELIAKLGDLITDVVAVRSCRSPDRLAVSQGNHVKR